MKTQWLSGFGLLLLICSACGVVEKSQRHGFENGYYTVKGDSAILRKAYIDIRKDTIRVYAKNRDTLGSIPTKIIPFEAVNLDCKSTFLFNKQSLDIDITSVLLKYRTGKNGLPSELTADFNAAFYSGWRWDFYSIKSEKDPLKNCRNEFNSRGFDIGAFAGLGTTPVSPFSTRGEVSDDYSGMVFQYGIAGFLNASFVSFGLAAGFDNLLTPDKKSWIYQNKLWLGFIIGIALN